VCYCARRRRIRPRPMTAWNDEPIVILVFIRCTMVATGGGGMQAYFLNEIQTHAFFGEY
jgi:hypothetical protein